MIRISPSRCCSRSPSGSAAAQAAGAGCRRAARSSELVTVTGDVVRIGDLVDNAGAAADVAVFRAPDLGADRHGRRPARRRGACARTTSIGARHRAASPRSWSRAPSRAITGQGHRGAHRPRARRPASASATPKNIGDHVRPRASHASTSSRPPPPTSRSRASTSTRAAAASTSSLDLPGSARGAALPLRFTGIAAETVEAAALTRADRARRSPCARIRRRRSSAGPRREAAGDAIADADAGDRPGRHAQRCAPARRCAAPT